jgi:hypothetical protein
VPIADAEVAETFQESDRARARGNADRASRDHEHADARLSLTEFSVAEQGDGRGPDHLTQTGAHGDRHRHAEHHAEQRRQKKAAAHTEHSGEQADHDAEQEQRRETDGLAGDVHLPTDPIRSNSRSGVALRAGRVSGAADRWPRRRSTWRCPRRPGRPRRLRHESSRTLGAESSVIAMRAEFA